MSTANEEAVMIEPTGKETAADTRLAEEETNDTRVENALRVMRGTRSEKRPLRDLLTKIVETQAEQQLLPPPPPLSPEISEKVKIDYPSVNGTLEAVVYDSGLNQLARMPVNELVSKLDQTQGAKVVVFDGIVTQRLVDASSKAGVSSLVGHRTAEIHNKPDDLAIYSFKDLGLE